MAEVQEWRNHAACSKLPMSNEEKLALFFPKKGDTFTTRLAYAVCAGCPVQEECLDFATSMAGDAFGIWGGMSGRKRRQHRSVRLKEAS